MAFLVSPKTIRADITVAGTDGPVKIREIERDGIRLLDLSTFAKAQGERIDWLDVGSRVTFKSELNDFRFLIGASTCLLNDTIHQLGGAVVLIKGKLFVPTTTFMRLWERGERSAKTEKAVAPNSPKPVVNKNYDVSDLILSRRANGLLIELMLTAKTSYDIFLSEGNWMNISMPNAKVFSSQIESRFDARFFHKIRTHQVGNTGQVSLQFRNKIENWYHKYLDEPKRIQIIIVDTAAAMAALPVTATDTPIKPTTIKGTSADKIDKIVVDAGHGGRDNGAIGAGGTREKDITLQIARELEAQLKATGKFSVLMTRDKDETVSLEERARIANSAGADLFISIHCNANPKRAPRGWNVFFLAPAKNDSARSVEQFENSFFVREMGLSSDTKKEDETLDPIASILNEMILTEFQAESQEFALLLDSEFRDALKIPARGVDQAGFFVLNKIFMPSVLVETAFISNKTEEKLLKTKPFQQSVASAITQAVLAFQEKYESK